MEIRSKAETGLETRQKAETRLKTHLKRSRPRQDKASLSKRVDRDNQAEGGRRERG